MATYEFSKGLGYVDASSWVVAGQSAGGFTAVTVARNAPEGLVGAINFAGGYGGNPDTRRGSSCDPSAWIRSLRNKRSDRKVPTLWIYWKDDWFWGNQIPRDWFKAFIDGGGSGEFVQNEPIRGDGHGGFRRDFHAWMPIVQRFLTSLPLSSHLTATKLPSIPQESADVAVDAVDKVPLLSEKGIEAYKEFLKRESPKAFAMSETGNYAWSSGRWDVTAKALERCRAIAEKDCQLYAVDDKVVWGFLSR